MTFLASEAASAREASQLVRTAWSNYKTPVDYGLISVDLPKVAAMIAADLPTRLYYTAYRRNAFDSHVQQGEQHQRLLTDVSDAVSGFMQDMQRISRADDVTVLVFSEFGAGLPNSNEDKLAQGVSTQMLLQTHLPTG